MTDLTGEPPPTPRIYRCSIPVDDQWHDLTLPGPIVAYGCREADAVEFWYWHGRPGDTPHHRLFKVVGTGHPVPEAGQGAINHLATVVAPNGYLVWHLIEVPAIVKGGTP